MAVKENSKPLEAAVDLTLLEKKVEKPWSFDSAVALATQARFVTRNMQDPEITNEERLQAKEEELKNYCKSFENYLKDNDFVLVKKDLVKDGKVVAHAFVAPKEYEALEKFVEKEYEALEKFVEYARPGPDKERASTLLGKIQNQCVERHKIFAPCIEAYQPGFYQKKKISQIPEETIREIQHKKFEISKVRDAYPSPELKEWCREESKRLTKKEKSLEMTFGRKAAWFGIGSLPAAGAAIGILIAIGVVTGGIAIPPIIAGAVGCGVFFGLAAADKANSQHKEGKENFLIAFVNRQLDRFSKKTQGDVEPPPVVVKTPANKTPLHTSMSHIGSGLEHPGHSAREIAGAKSVVIPGEEFVPNPVGGVESPVVPVVRVSQDAPVPFYDDSNTAKNKEVDSNFNAISDLKKQHRKNSELLALAESLEALKRGVSKEAIDKAQRCVDGLFGGDPSRVLTLLGGNAGKVQTFAESIIEHAGSRLAQEPPSSHIQPKHGR